MVHAADEVGAVCRLTPDGAILDLGGSRGGSLDEMAKLNVFLVDLSNFALVNQIMAEYFQEPYPARAAIGVASLPRDASVEMDGILELDS